MRGIKVPLLILTITAFLFTASAEAQNIFVWDHDNNAFTTDLVFDEDSMTCVQSMTRTLDSLNYDYTLYNGAFLPDNLNNYDLVIIALGMEGCG
jgi:hypothetical protein